MERSLKRFRRSNSVRSCRQHGANSRSSSAWNARSGAILGAGFRLEVSTVTGAAALRGGKKGGAGGPEKSAARETIRADGRNWQRQLGPLFLMLALL